MRALEGGDAQGFIVGLESANAMFFEQGGKVAADIEESCDGRAGVTGEEVYASLGFERPFDEEFVAGEDFAAGIGQKARIDSRNPVCPSAGTL